MPSWTRRLGGRADGRGLMAAGRIVVEDQIQWPQGAMIQTGRVEQQCVRVCWAVFEVEEVAWDWKGVG